MHTFLVKMAVVHLASSDDMSNDILV